jgi:hypothetical protein
MASDGKWYPPELHPAVRAAAVTQAATATLAASPAPGMTSPVSAQPGYAQPGYAQPGYAQPGYAQPGYAQPGDAAAGSMPLAYGAPGYGAGPDAPAGFGAAVPTGPDGALTVVAPPKKSRRRGRRSGNGAAPPGMVVRPGPAPRGFEENSYALPRHLPMGPVPTKKKGHLALPLVLLLVAALVAAAGTVGFILTHPSPHRSPDAVALDFYQKLAASPMDATAVLADVVPSQQGQAASLTSLREVQSVSTELQHENLSVLNPSTPLTTSKSVEIQGCNEILSCGPVAVTVPTVEVQGKWYVDFAAWDVLAQHMVADN